MSCEDFTMALLSEYVAGELAPPDAARVSAHVSQCDRCQGKVSTLREIGPALGLTGEGAPIDTIDHTFALARAGARAARDAARSHPDCTSDGMADAPPSRSPRRSPVPVRVWVPVAAMAAALLLTFGLRSGADPELPFEASESTLTWKGTDSDGQAAQARLDLSFSAQEIDGSLSRGRSGGRYRPDQVLYFRCHLPGAGHILLVRVAADRVEVLEPDDGKAATPAGPGSWDLSDGTHLLGYGLESLSGPQQFVALFSPRPFQMDASLDALLRSGKWNQDLLRQRDLISAEVAVDVAP